jgi:predicted enzyme related to lactoylglutathione lyase
MGAPFVWFDVTTTGDNEAVRGFYTELFGWSAGPAAGDYQGWFTDGDQPWAGLLPAEPAAAGRWIPYVVVDDLDAAAKRAVALGGAVVRDRTAGPAGTAVLVADPAGAVVALFTPAAA